MNRIATLAAWLLIFTTCDVSADDWEGWDTLPDYLLENGSGPDSVEDIDKKLGQLLTRHEGDLDNTERLMINRWLLELTRDSKQLKQHSLEKLLEQQDKLSADELSKWQEELLNELEDDQDNIESETEQEDESDDEVSSQADDSQDDDSEEEDDD